MFELLATIAFIGAIYFLAKELGFDVNGSLKALKDKIVGFFKKN